MEPSQQIDQYILKHADWKGEMIKNIRKIVLNTVPGVEEEWKWNSPVWSSKGLVCSASAFKKHVGLNFFQGASISDPDRFFNSGMESKKSRSINFTEGAAIDEAALKALLLKAVEVNREK